MKIADIAEFYSEAGGGVRTYLEDKLEQGGRLGVHTTIIAPGPDDRVETRPAGRIVWIKSPLLPLDRNYHRFRFVDGDRAVHQVLDELRPDLLEVSSPWQGAWIGARWRGSAATSIFFHQDPVAVYPHALLDRVVRPERLDRSFGWFWRYLDKLSRQFDTSVVSGAWLAEKLARHGLRRPAAISLGVDKARFLGARPSEARRVQMLAACGLGPEATLAVSIGRHHPEKRIDVLIEAAKRMSETRPFGLYLIGDGPRRKAVEARAARVPGVFVAGVERDRDALAEQLASADFYLHGGAAETFGLAVAEAISAGLPTVAPDTGGAGDLVGPDWGEPYRAGDVEACVAAIERLLARDRTALVGAARAAAERINTPEAHFTRLFEHYGEVLAAKRAREAEAWTLHPAPVRAPVAVAQPEAG